MGNANAGTITMVDESLQMKLILKMEFPTLPSIAPLRYSASHSESISDSTSGCLKRIASNKLYQSFEVSETKTGAQNSSWSYGYSEFKCSENIWQTKSYLKQHDEPNPAINYGLASVQWEMAFDVQGAGITYDASCGSQPVSIEDLTTQTVLGQKGSLCDGHRYRVVMISELECYDELTDQDKSSELQIFNAGILPPPAILKIGIQ